MLCKNLINRFQVPTDILNLKTLCCSPSEFERHLLRVRNNGRVRVGALLGAGAVPSGAVCSSARPLPGSPGAAHHLLRGAHAHC